MQKKAYKNSENKPVAVNEPAVAYRRMESTDTGDWNPNVPIHATQEEWWEHIHRIEKGHFTPWEDAEQEFKIWKKEYLASRLK